MAKKKVAVTEKHIQSAKTAYDNALKAFDNAENPTKAQTINVAAAYAKLGALSQEGAFVGDGKDAFNSTKATLGQEWGTLQQQQALELTEMKSAGATAKEIAAERAANKTELGALTSYMSGKLKAGELQDLTADGFFAAAGMPITAASTYGNAAYAGNVQGGIQEVQDFFDQYNLRPRVDIDEDTATGYDYKNVSNYFTKKAAGEELKAPAYKMFSQLEALGAGSPLTAADLQTLTLGGKKGKLTQLDDGGYSLKYAYGQSGNKNDHVMYFSPNEDGTFGVSGADRYLWDDPPEKKGGIFGKLGAIGNILSWAGKLIPGPWTPYAYALDVLGKASTVMSGIGAIQDKNPLGLVLSAAGIGDWASGGALSQAAKNVLGTGGIADAAASAGDVLDAGVAAGKAVSDAATLPSGYNLGDMDYEALYGEGGFPDTVTTPSDVWKQATTAPAGWSQDGWNNLSQLDYGNGALGTNNLNLEGTGFNEMLNAAGEAGQAAQTAGIQDAINNTSYGDDFVSNTYSGTPNIGTAADGTSVQLGNPSALNAESQLTAAAMSGNLDLLKDTWTALAGAGAVSLGGKSLWDYAKMGLNALNGLGSGAGAGGYGGSNSLSNQYGDFNWMVMNQGDPAQAAAYAMQAAANTTR